MAAAAPRGDAAGSEAAAAKTTFPFNGSVLRPLPLLRLEYAARRVRNDTVNKGTREKMNFAWRAGAKMGAHVRRCLARG